jgi:hypothetical protein
MTAADWEICWNPRAMLDSLPRRASGRKLRLFACACVRRVWHLLPDARSRTAVEVVERFADAAAVAEDVAAAWADAAAAAGDDAGGTATLNALANAAMAAESAAGADARVIARDASCWAVLAAAWYAATQIPDGSHKPWGNGRARTAAEKTQCNLLRDLFGNPFISTTFDPSWRIWNDHTVIRLAVAAYDHREMPFGLLDNALLAILADALEEAGCSEQAILDHLRDGCEHVRGCHVLDSVLGRF